MKIKEKVTKNYKIFLKNYYSIKHFLTNFSEFQKSLTNDIKPFINWFYKKPYDFSVGKIQMWETLWDIFLGLL